MRSRISPTLGPGGSASAWKADVTQEDSIVTVLGHVVERFGRLDAIINNAGVDVTIGIQDLASEDWHRVMATNLSGPFFFAKHGLKHLALGGHIINIASTAARRAWPNASAYHASKWGLLGLTQALHAELRGNGIKVSAIIAGGMRTPFLLDRFPDIDVELLQDPVHVAHAVRFVFNIHRHQPSARSSNRGAINNRQNPEKLFPIATKC